MASAKKDIERIARLGGAVARYKLEPLTATTADVVKAIMDRFKASFHRNVLDDGTVRVSVEMANGDRLAASGETTDEAVGNLHTRLEAWPDA